MRLINADKIKFTEYVNGDIAVSKEEIQKMPTSLDLDKLIARINDMMSPTDNYCQKFCDEMDMDICEKQNNCDDCLANAIIRLIKSETEGENETD